MNGKLGNCLAETIQIAVDRPTGSASQPKAMSWVQIAAVVVILSAAAVFESIRVSAVLAPAVWVHVRTGAWMLQAHAFPRTGLFSQYPNLAWDDGNWLFDLVLGIAYRAMGLKAIEAMLILLKVGLAAAAFLLARAVRANVWLAIILSAIAQYVTVGLQPLPSAASILLFGVVLILIVRSHFSGDVRGLWWLPALFLLWANLDFEFIFGLALLVLFVAATAMESGLRSLGAGWIGRQVQLPALCAIAGLSCAASLINPYTFHVFPAAWRTLYTSVGFEHFSEMSALTFRRPQDYVLMLLVMLAFLALGRRRAPQVFELCLLLATTAVAFRIQRDAWLVVLPAIVILAREIRWDSPDPAFSWPLGKIGWAAAGLTAAVVVGSIAILPSNRKLMDEVSRYYPVKAADYISQNHLSTPLFNSYSWGSFLTWYLPQYPVAIDSRVALYGDELLDAYFKVSGGKELLEQDAAVSRARTLLLERESPMAKALVNLPALRAQYRLVYSDDLASVFVPQGPKP